MSKEYKIPKRVLRSDGVMTTVYVKGEDVKLLRPLPAVPATVPSVAGLVNPFAKGDHLSSTDDFDKALVRTMVKTDRGDIMIKKDDGWNYVGLAGLGSIPSPMMASRGGTVMA